MAKYCAKCGQEIQGDVKFCKACGASVEMTEAEQSDGQTVASAVQPKKVNVNSKKKIGIIAAVLFIVIAVLVPVFKNMSVPGYERPLKAQVDGINKNQIDRYLDSYTERGKKMKDEYAIKNEIEAIDDVSYEIVGVDDRSLNESQVKDEIIGYGGELEDVEAVKLITANVSYQRKGTYGSVSKKVTTVEVWVLEVGGKWYADSGVAFCLD